MPKMVVVIRNGTATTIEAEVGRSLMEIIRGAEFDELAAVCGGCCACATCHILVDAEFEERLPKLEKDEDELLDASDHRMPNSRLACQISFNASFDGLKVRIAPEG